MGIRFKLNPLKSYITTSVGIDLSLEKSRVLSINITYARVCLYVYFLKAFFDFSWNRNPMRVLGSSAAWRYIATNSGAMRQYPGRQTYNNRSAGNFFQANASNLTSFMYKTASLILESMDNCFCLFGPTLRTCL